MTRPRIVYLVTEDWYFVSHRLPMARAARDAGYEVHVVTHVENYRAAIEAEGFQLHPIDLHRGSINPFNVIAGVLEVRRLYRSLAPAAIHHIALQAIVIGSIAAMGLQAPQINSILGFGSVFTSRKIKARVARIVARLVLPFILNRNASLALVVNPEHSDTLRSFGIASERIVIFPGSGVDVDRLRPLPEPPEPITVGYVGRMLEDKGVNTLMSAYQKLRDKGLPLELVLGGTPDPYNISSITVRELESWSRLPGVSWVGHVSDIGSLWAKAHIAVLASRTEGLPLSLLEAAACGRPIVASDIPGCREIAHANVNALLVPPDDPQALADAIERLAADAELRRKFGAAGRQLVETSFSSVLVGQKIVAIYDRLTTRRPEP